MANPRTKEVIADLSEDEFDALLMAMYGGPDPRSELLSGIITNNVVNEGDSR